MVEETKWFRVVKHSNRLRLGFYPPGMGNDSAVYMGLTMPFPVAFGIWRS